MLLQKHIRLLEPVSNRQKAYMRYGCLIRTKSCVAQKRVHNRDMLLQVGLRHATKTTSSLNQDVEVSSHVQKSVINAIALDVIAKWSQLPGAAKEPDVWTCNSSTKKVGDSVCVIRPDPLSYGYPDLELEVISGTSEAFRLLLMLRGWRRDGQELLHVLACPRISLDLPLFSLDLLTANGAVQHALVDTPSLTGPLPRAFRKAKKDLENALLPDVCRPYSGAAKASPPSDGSSSSSSSCPSVEAILCSPSSGAEFVAFLKFCSALLACHAEHCQRIVAAAADTSAPPAPGGSLSVVEALRAEAVRHRSFGESWIQSSKVAHVIEGAFGKAWMSKNLGQVAVSVDDILAAELKRASAARWVDAPAALRGFLDHAVSGLAPAAKALRGKRETDGERVEREVHLQRIEAYLGQAKGDPVIDSLKVENALSYLYDHDPQFRTNVDVLLPEAAALRAEDSLGRLLCTLAFDLDK